MPDKQTPPRSDLKVLPFSDATPAKVEIPPYDGPLLPQKCWRRGFLEFKNAFQESTDASDEYFFSGFASIVSCILGRNARAGIGYPLFANTYIVNVGATGAARKSTAQSFATELLTEIVGKEVLVCRGISSAEGVLLLLKQSKKVLINLGETRILLAKGRQESTKTLIPQLTDLYDCPPTSAIPTRHQPIEVENPYLCGISSTTLPWLQNSMPPDDILGGFAGRLWYFVGAPKAEFAWPPMRKDADISLVKAILTTMRGLHGEERIYHPTAKAKVIYDTWFKSKRKLFAESDNELSAAISARLHTHAIRMAMMHAAIENSPQIQEEHIESGCAFANYQWEVQQLIIEGLEDTKNMRIDRSLLKCLGKYAFDKLIPTWEVRRLRPRLDPKETYDRLKTLAKVGDIITAVKDGTEYWGARKGTMAH